MSAATRARADATRADGPERRAGSETYLLVTQVRSSIGTKPKHRQTLRALGLRGVGRARVLPDRPEVRGMISRVPHLVEVAEASSEQVSAQHEAQREAFQARRTAQGQRGQRQTGAGGAGR
jgi:large subunit ribosomal protein L30